MSTRTYCPKAIEVANDHTSNPSGSLGMAAAILLAFVAAAALFAINGPIAETTKPLDWRGNAAGSIVSAH